MLAEQAKNALKLKIMIPGKCICDTVVQGVVFPSDSGEMCVLPGHAEMFTHLGYGVLVYEASGVTKIFSVEEGVAHIKNNEVLILADSIEEASAIDIERAQKALERARERLKGSINCSVDLVRAENAQLRARSRLDALARVNLLKK